MARINIEEKFWFEITQVAIAMGDLDRAVGQAVRFFKLAQEAYREGKTITEEEFVKHGFSKHLLGHFAKQDQAGNIVCLGAAKHFGWIDKKRQAGAAGGKRSASRPRDENGRLKPAKQDQANTKQMLGKTPSTDQASPSPSPSLSLSSSPSSSGSSSKKEKRKTTVPSEPQRADHFVAAYCDRFKSRWGISPPIQGKDAGIAKRLAKNLSLDRFERLLDAYFSMPDAWLVKQKHPLNLFESKLSEVAVFADTGTFTTARQVREADSMATTMQLLNDVKEGKI